MMEMSLKEESVILRTSFYDTNQKILIKKMLFPKKVIFKVTQSAIFQKTMHACYFRVFWVSCVDSDGCCMGVVYADIILTKQSILINHKSTNTQSIKQSTNPPINQPPNHVPVLKAMKKRNPVLWADEPGK